ncbi:MAG: hypothetical protein JWR01_1027 [Subtercola sp.]|nr:hypothetical protein [Subtercola sp.]
MKLYGLPDGKGPQLGWFPRFLRPWVNRTWVKNGWTEPYDSNLRKVPRRDR